LTHKYFGGVIPEPGPFTEAENTLIDVLNAAPGLVSVNLENYKFRQALSEMMNVARAGNKYLAETEPWKLIKIEPNRVATILFLANQTCALLTLLMEPFLPFSAEVMREMLPDFPQGWPIDNQLNLLNVGSHLGESKILFSKITDEEVQSQLDKLENAKRKTR
jgi:methionyl-tRNA synthetase